MRALSKENLCDKNIVSLFGAAFLWPCLQASGFYPVSIIPEVGSLGAHAAAQYHLQYSAMLLIMVVLAFLARKSFDRILNTGRIVPFAIGVFGAIGQGFLCFAQPQSTAFRFFVVGGMLLVALFIAFYVMFWSCKISKIKIERVVLIAACSYLLSQVFSIVYYATGLAQGYFLVACSVLSATCALFSAPNATDERSYKVSSLKNLNWSMTVPALFLVYFCIIFVRVLSGRSSGDASTFYKMAASVISAAAFVVVIAIYLAKKSDTKSNLIVIFAFLVMLYIVSLAIMLLLSGQENPFVRRTLIASEHCFEAFIWILLMYTANRKRLSPTLVFGFYVLVVIAIPWMLSYDFYHLSGLYEIVSGNDVFVPAVTVASLIAAISTIVFLLSYSFKLGKESAEQKDDWRKGLLENALIGVNSDSREFEIAELVYRGYSAKKIANMLYVSEPTVKRYTAQLYRRYDIHSKQEFISYVDSFGEGTPEL